MPHMCRGTSAEPPLGAVRPLSNFQLIRVNLPVALHARQREAPLRQRSQRKDLLHHCSAAVRSLILQRKADKAGHAISVSEHLRKHLHGGFSAAVIIPRLPSKAGKAEHTISTADQQGICLWRD